jgi:type I restriction enzyme S subunit
METIIDNIKVEKYSEYKDSGVDWLGEIPKEWAIKRIKHLFSEINERSFDGSEDLLSVSQYTGVTNKTEKLEDGGMLTNAATLEGYKKVWKDDLVSNIMLAWNGSLGFSPFDGITSPAYSIYRLKTNDVNRYFHYLLRTDLYKSEFKRNSSGVIESRLRLYTDDFFRIESLIPPPPEQTAIAAFLDRKTALIDQAIDIKQKQIELLKERRQILIHRAVTRGLNPNVKMKDSGVEWIGEIPEDWEVARVKQYSNKISKGTTPSTEGRSILDEGPIRYIKAENIQDGFITNSPAHFIDEKTNAMIQRSQLKENDILFVIAGATLGKIAIVSKEHTPSNTNQAVAFVRPSSKVIPQYLAAWLSSSIIKELTWLVAVQSAQPNLSMENLGNFPVVLPSLEEQENILIHIDNGSTKIATAISLKEQEIEKLKEYKATLINSAVTGKIMVNG